MEYIKLNNGIDMPVIGYGTYKLKEEEQCVDCVKKAIAAGYRLIDTAQAYKNEEFVGRAIKESGVDRSELFIITKVWFTTFESGDCYDSVITSMEKLGVDYIDMVLLHWPFGNVYAAWRDLEKLVDESKIRAIGVSNMKSDRLIDHLTFNRIQPALNQVECHLYAQAQEDHEWHKKYNVHLQGYGPLGQGRSPEMFEEEPVKALAEKYGKSPAQIILRFFIQCGISVIPKSKKEERMKENLDVFDFSLTEEEISSLKALDRRDPKNGESDDPAIVEFRVR